MLGGSFFQDDLLRTKTLLGTELKDGDAGNSFQGAPGQEGIIASCFFPEQQFIYAGLSRGVQQSYLSFLACSVVFSAFAAVLLGYPIVLVLPCVVYFILQQSIESKIQKRQTSFDKDYAALLLSLSSGLKTGLDPLVALSRCAELFQSESVLRQELEKFEKSLAEGKTEDESIDTFGSSVRHPDIKLFRMAFKLARKEGASLAVCLQRLARVTRQRQSFRRKTRGAVAMQKLSALGIGLCTMLIGFIQAVSNGSALLEAFQHPIGKPLLCMGLGLVVAGLVWMLQMSKLRV